MFNIGLLFISANTIKTLLIIRFVLKNTVSTVFYVDCWSSNILQLRADKNHVGTEYEIDEEKAQEQFKKLLALAAKPETIELSNQAKQLINEIEANLLLRGEGTSPQ